MITKEFIEANIEIIPFSGCWIWLGKVNTGGYGYIYSPIDQGQHRMHRASYETYIGPVPEGLYVCHQCDIKSCINPSHLYAGTPGDNTRDLFARQGSSFMMQEYCRREHALVSSNIYLGTRGRQCLMCKRAQGRKWKALNSLAKKLGN